MDSFHNIQGPNLGAVIVPPEELGEELERRTIEYRPGHQFIVETGQKGIKHTGAEDTTEMLRRQMEIGGLHEVGFVVASRVVSGKQEVKN